MLRKICLLVRYATSFKIRGCGADNPLELGKFLRAQRQFVDLTGADPNVGMLGDQVRDAIGKRQLNLDFGIALQKVRQCRYEPVDAKCIAGIDVEAATGSAA